MTLPNPIYATPNAQTDQEAFTAQFVELTGREIFPAQVESLLIEYLAQASTIAKQGIQFAGEQTLVNFATGANLDQLGDGYGVPRLEPQAALTTLEFTLSTVSPNATLIPIGTRVRTADSQFLFELLNNVVVPAGELTGQGEAIATVIGDAANGYAAGQVSSLFDQVSNVASVTNLTETNSGGDAEGDEAYRTRIKLGLNALNTAGSRDAYRFLVLSADPSITNVSVRSLDDDERIAQQNVLAEQNAQAFIDLVQNSPYSIDMSSVPLAELAATAKPYVQLTRFFVEVYVLTKTGLPSGEIISKVIAALDRNDRRPLTDTVKVFSPQNVSQALSVNVTLLSSADGQQLSADLNAAAQAYATEISGQLGRDIVPSQIIAALSLEGVKEVTVNSPASAIAVDVNQRPLITSITINLVGVANE
jgi:phage-related baseplate assembly protein